MPKRYAYEDGRRGERRHFVGVHGLCRADNKVLRAKLLGMQPLPPSRAQVRRHGREPVSSARIEEEGVFDIPGGARAIVDNLVDDDANSAKPVLIIRQCSDLRGKKKANVIA